MKNVYPLHEAAYLGNVEEVNRLISEGFDLESHDFWSKTPLHIAAEGGQFNVARTLITLGAQLDAVRGLIGETPLHLASGYGHRLLVNLLLAHGANVNAKTPDGVTPLAFASYGGHLEVVELLIEYDADVEARDVWGNSAIHYAAYNHHEAVISFLREHGCAEDAPNLSGFTALELHQGTEEEEWMDLYSVDCPEKSSPEPSHDLRNNERWCGDDSPF